MLKITQHMTFKLTVNCTKFEGVGSIEFVPEYFVADLVVCNPHLIRRV